MGNAKRRRRQAASETPEQANERVRQGWQATLAIEVVEPTQHSQHVDVGTEFQEGAVGGIAADDWQPIATAPRDGTSFLAWDSDGMVMAVCYFSTDATLCFEATGSIVEHDADDDAGFWPSHWQPRPEPP